MRLLITVLALSLSVAFLGCEKAENEEITITSPGALQECPAACSAACCEKAKKQDSNLGAVSDDQPAQKTCPFSGTSLGTFDGKSSCCPAKAGSEK
jgi:hypothetical protein